MLKRFSFYDIINTKEFEGLTQFDLLQKKYDEDVKPLLWLLGADVDRGLRIQACVHRTLDNKTVIGYTYVTLERTDKEWLKDPRCTMSARIQAQEDKWLAADMAMMCCESSGESGFKAMCEAVAGAEGTTRSLKKDVSETWEEDRATILALQEIQRNVRGLHSDEYMFEDEQSYDEYMNPKEEATEEVNIINNKEGEITNGYSDYI